MFTRTTPSVGFSGITLVISWVCFIAVPVLVTLFIPASWITLEPDATTAVSATSRTCLLFVVPWRVQHVEEVTGAEVNILRGDRLLPHRSRGHSHPNRASTSSDGEAALTVAGRGGSLTVKVSPDSVEEVKAKVHGFLQDPSQGQIRIFTIANWKFGLGFGIPCTLLAALYIVGGILAILRKLWPGRLAR